MADDAAPYSGAIEETAKTAGKALDLIKDASGPVADVYGIIIGDKIHAARSRRLDEITRKTKKILRDRDLSETAEVAEQVAIPLLEAAQREPREEMQELWARLLANAMDPARRDDVRPEFIETLKEFHPIDAVVLQKLAEKAAANSPWVATGNIVAEVGFRPAAVSVSLEKLKSLNCAIYHPDVGAFRMTEFGAEFLMACMR